jgi:predicted nucleic acid-binding protein
MAAALQAECIEVISEDLQDGMLIDGKMRIRDPFCRAA